MIASPEFMLTLPRKAQRRLPADHIFSVKEVTGRVGLTKKTATVVTCKCGWESKPLSPEAVAHGGIVGAVHNHMLEEAARLS
jgi:hypothetical protein